MNDMPYTVPEGFFEKSRAAAMKSATDMRRRRFGTGVALCTLAVVAGIFLFTGRPGTDTLMDYCSDSQIAELAEVFENDIFLNQID